MVRYWHPLFIEHGSTYNIKMLLSTDIYGIKTEYRTRNRRKTQIKLQQQEKNKVWAHGTKIIELGQEEHKL